MAAVAEDFPAIVTVSENGVQGIAGADGADGLGFNNVRKALIDNPLVWLYAKNGLVKVVDNGLTISRTTSGSYVDIYGVTQTAANDIPREEVNGWLFDGDETHTFEANENIPVLTSAFSFVLRVGDYLETSPAQSIISVLGTTGELFTIGSNALGNWVATLRGSDNIIYSSATTETATNTNERSIIVVFESGVLNLYIDGVISGSVTLPTGSAHTLDTTSLVTFAGDFDLNMQEIRVYDFAFNSSEIEYLE